MPLETSPAALCVSGIEGGGDVKRSRDTAPRHELTSNTNEYESELLTRHTGVLSRL